MSDTHFKVIEGRAYSVKNKLFLVDSYPCDYIATFDDGKIAACYQGHARFINEVYEPITAIPGFHLLVNVIPDICSAIYINNGVFYTLPDRTCAMYKKDFTYEDDDKYITLSSSGIYKLIYPRHDVHFFNMIKNTVIYIFPMHYYQQLNLVEFSVCKEDGRQIRLFTNTKLPILSIGINSSRLYTIEHFKGTFDYYYITERDNSFLLVSIQGDVIELVDNIGAVETRNGKIIEICRGDDCIIEPRIDENSLEPDFMAIVKLKNNKLSFNVCFTSIQQQLNFTIYSCGCSYFLDADNIIRYIQSFNVFSNIGKNTKPAIRDE